MIGCETKLYRDIRNEMIYKINKNRATEYLRHLRLYSRVPDHNNEMGFYKHLIFSHLIKHLKDLLVQGI